MVIDNGAYYHPMIGIYKFIDCHNSYTLNLHYFLQKNIKTGVSVVYHSRNIQADGGLKAHEWPYAYF